MKLKVQLVVCAEDGREEHVQEIAVLDKECQHIEHLGLTLTPMGKPPPLAVRLEKALPFRR